MILTMNNFVFNDQHFIQQHGTAMGTRMAPAYANLFMGEFERKALKDYTDQPYPWLRYIHDTRHLHGLDTRARKADQLYHLPKQHSLYNQIH